MSGMYPLSMHCRFEGFPARVEVTCGPAFSAMAACPYGYGSRVACRQTPLSGQVQGRIVPGAPLPPLEIVYADTGDDAVFDLKLSYYGRGLYYLAAPGDETWTLAVIKGLRLEAGLARRVFETSDVWRTRIPAETDLTAPGLATGLAWRDGEDLDGTFSAVWYGGQAPVTSCQAGPSGQTELDGPFVIGAGGC